MILFRAKDPMTKWRQKYQAMAELADRTGWRIDLDREVVCTVIAETPVVVILAPPMRMGPSAPATSVIIEAGRQAEATLAGRIGDVVGGAEYTVNGWCGVAEAGNGLIDGNFSGPHSELVDAVVAAVYDLVDRVRRA